VTINRDIFGLLAKTTGFAMTGKIR
jgi:hypothetical protein